ncbi:MAG: hypothetical protein AAFN92_20525, partial [Bacteroidota bacterium]
MSILINDNTLRTIPFFSENQVLRATDLNNLVDAVLRQLRQQRMFTAGLGIRAGSFALRWEDGEGEDALGCLVVTAGFGVSSNGYGFDLGECRFKFCRKLSDDFSRAEPLAGQCEEYKKLLAALVSGGYELATELPQGA